MLPFGRSTLLTSCELGALLQLLDGVARGCNSCCCCCVCGNNCLLSSREVPPPPDAGAETATVTTEADEATVLDGIVIVFTCGAATVCTLGCL
uniref:Putative secreted protein n=1 Tax=Anopheles darlingi TaxID=43151 RepID=A0A2M4D722_ANODA